jgi:hypothetical protein
MLAEKGHLTPELKRVRNRLAEIELQSGDASGEVR